METTEIILIVLGYVLGISALAWSYTYWKYAPAKGALMVGIILLALAIMGSWKWANE